MNNLGIALGAYTNEMNRQREQQRADAADQRQQQQFDLQMQEAERVKGIRSQRESEVQRLQQIRGALANPNDPTNWAVLQQAAKDYGVGNIERMGNSVGVFAGGEQGVPQFRPLDLGAYTKIARERLAMLEPESAMAYMDSVDARAYDEGWKNKTFGLEQRKLDITRDSDAWKRDAAMRGLDIDELKARAYARGIAAQSGGGGRSSRPEMREVTWMGQDGKPRTGLVAFAQEGGRLRAYDPATGQELPVQDPRYQAAVGGGVPRNTRPELSIQDRKTINEQAALNLEQILMHPNGKRLPLEKAQRMATDMAFRQFGLPVPGAEHGEMVVPYGANPVVTPAPTPQPARPWGINFDAIKPPMNSRIPE